MGRETSLPNASELTMVVLDQWSRSCYHKPSLGSGRPIITPLVCPMLFKLVCRTYGISGRNKNIGIFLLTFGILCTAGEWFIDLYGRRFLQNQNV